MLAISTFQGNWEFAESRFHTCVTGYLKIYGMIHNIPGVIAIEMINIDGLMHERRTSIALAMELRLFRINHSMCS